MSDKQWVRLVMHCELIAECLDEQTAGYDTTHVDKLMVICNELLASAMVYRRVAIFLREQGCEEFKHVTFYGSVFLHLSPSLAEQLAAMGLGDVVKNDDFAEMLDKQAAEVNDPMDWEPESEDDDEFDHLAGDPDHWDPDFDPGDDDDDDDPDPYGLFSKHED